MSIFHELQNSAAGQALAKVGFRPSEESDSYVKLFADSMLSLHVNKPGPMRGPRKMSEPVLLDIFDIHEPTPSMRLQFPTVTDFLKSVYDHR